MREPAPVGFAAALAQARRRNEWISAVTRDSGELLTGSAGAGLEFAYAAGCPTSGGDAGSAYDLRMVQQLLERCWREIDASELNVKLTDLVRLLELKGKLSPQAGAERTFWSLIDQMRHDQLADFGDVPSTALPDPDNEEP